MKKIIITVVCLVIALGLITCGKDEGRKGSTNSNLVNNGIVAIADGWIYYGIGDGLYKCKEDGTEKQKIYDMKVNGFLTGINVVDDWIYFSGDGVYRVKTDGSAAEQISTIEKSGGLHIIGDTIHYSNEYIMELDGSDSKQIYTAKQTGKKSVNIIDDQYYFIDFDDNNNYVIYKMDLDGENIEIVCDKNISEMLVYGDSIYYVDSEGYTLCKMDLDGSNQQIMDYSYCARLNAEDGWIYYYSLINGVLCLCKITVDGNDKQVICTDSGNEIIIVGEWIYFTEQDALEYIIKRVKKDGTNYEIFERSFR